MIKKKKVFFVLFLVSCIFLSMSFISANTNIMNDDSQLVKCDDYILENNTDNNLLEDDDLNESNEDYYPEIAINYTYVKEHPPVLITNHDLNSTNNANTSKVVISKSSIKLFAKNKVFNKKVKTKLYPVILKSIKGKVLKNTLVTLKINGKIFKAKTNNKGEATFKISKLNKKGTYKATLTYKGNAKYNKTIKKVKIKIK